MNLMMMLREQWMKHFLQLLAVFIHFIVSLKAMYLVYAMSISCIDIYHLALIPLLVMDMAASNQSIKLHDTIFDMAKRVTTTVYVFCNVCEIFLAQHLLFKPRPTDEAQRITLMHFYAYWLILAQSCCMMFYIVFEYFLFCALSQENFMYYKTCRRMMEDIPYNFNDVKRYNSIY